MGFQPIVFELNCHGINNRPSTAGCLESTCIWCAFMDRFLHMSSLTFAQPEDGSYLIVDRGGGKWFSEIVVTTNNICPLQPYKKQTWIWDAGKFLRQELNTVLVIISTAVKHPFPVWKKSQVS